VTSWEIPKVTYDMIVLLDACPTLGGCPDLSGDGAVGMARTTRIELA
jgi:hypothetical protein